MRSVVPLLLHCFLLPISALAQSPVSSGIEFFEKKIRPVLVENCYSCHSEQAQRNKKLRGGLLLDSKRGILAGGESGPVLVPGKSRDSLLYQSLLHASDVKMPPKGKLKTEIITDFAYWIDMGAPDPRTDGGKAVRKEINLKEARKFWSLQPIRPVAPNRVQNDSWPRSAIDHFVLARLEKEALNPSSDADRGTLLRRLYFDLIGLPPEPQVVEAFVKDKDANAYEKVVDHLLASPHFGERWGRHWLDVARYAESNGRERNMAWHHAWRYRDWVVKAHNEDLPFDQFIAAQIAGDLLPADNHEHRDAMRTATGFLALGAKAFEETNREIFRMDMIDEQIDVISKAFLGLSVACARCHDHKFDPVPTKDYYALAGILRSTHTLYGWGPMGIRGGNDSDLQPIGKDAATLAPPALEHLQKLKEHTQKRNTARSDRYRIVRKVADLQTQLSRTGVDAAKIKSEIQTFEAEIKNWDIKVKQLEQEVKDLEANPPPQPDWVMAAREADRMENVRIHIRGETTNLGEQVPRGLLQVIQIPALSSIAKHESGRRQLAYFLASPANPLTPRVAVNRIWLHLFGQGLVATPDDFGMNGARPSHPELLDYLAHQFTSEGWSVKKLIRSIVLSRTYQLSSDVITQNQEVDPDNVFLWRHRPRHLEAEAIRDAILAANAQLDRKPMKGSVVSRLHPYLQPEFNSFALFLKPEQQEHRHRSLYLPVVRGSLPEFLKLFDFPDPSMPIGHRDATVVPAQASFLLNSLWMIEQAGHLARRVLSETWDSDEARLERLYLLTLCRLPTEKERIRGLKLLAQPLGSAGGKNKSFATEKVTLEQWTAICQVLLASAEFRYLF